MQAQGAASCIRADSIIDATAYRAVRHRSHEIEGGSMSGASAFDFARGDFRGRLLNANGLCVFLSSADPIIHARRLGWGHFEARTKWRQVFRQLPDNLLQGLIS